MNWRLIFTRGIAISIMFFMFWWVLDDLHKTTLSLFWLFNFCFIFATFVSKYEWGILGFLTRRDKG